MIRGGRPLRFLAIVLGGWIGVRVVLLWPASPTARPDGARATDAIPRPAAAAPAPVLAWHPAEATIPVRLNGGLARVTPPPVVVVPPPSASPPPVAETAPAPAIDPPRPARDPSALVLSLLGMVRYGAPEPPPPGERRWSASGWAMVRGPGGGAGVATPQLGGSQAGFRIARTLDAAGRVAATARVAAALGVPQQEAAFGVEWRPTRLPVRLVAEQRVGLAATRGGPALGLVGGVGDVPVGGGFRLDGYAQAGGIARNGVEGYADGALRVTTPAFRTGAGTSLDLGVGAWGAAQRDARRLDVGPVATIALPVGRDARVRLSVEWRRRIAGHARPSGGPALSIGADY